jgi:G protein-coupled receptor 111
MDLSCVIKNIQQSPRIPGNIAVIVQLLHNISTVLMTNVDEAKMQVSGLKYLVDHYLHGKGI